MLSTFLLYYGLFAASIYLFIYRPFFHPLAKIPGPWLARVTKLWFVWQVRKGKCHLLIPALHKKYGPMVRITPDQVVICSEDVVKAAYGAGSSFARGDWYHVTAPPARAWNEAKKLDLLAQTDVHTYREQRRAMGPAYSMPAVEKHEDLLNSYIEKYAARLKTLKGEKVSLAMWTHIYALDAMATFTLSETPGYTEFGDDDGNLAASDTVWGAWTVVGLFPGAVKFFYSIPMLGIFLFVIVCPLLGMPIPRFWRILAAFAPDRIFRKLRGIKEVEAMPGAREALSVPALHSKYDHLDAITEHYFSLDKEARFPAPWIVGMAMTNFAAGHDTVMISLSTCIYHVYTHPPILSRLRADFSTQNLTPESKYSDLVTKVPLLLAILKESMRLWPPQGFWVPRVVPAAGATISNTHFPGGTTVGVSLWALNYDPEIWTDPHTFDPDRWMLDGTEEKQKAVHRLDGLNMWFGGQQRSCPGQNIGKLFVVKMLARLVMEFDVELSGTPEFRGWFSLGLKETLKVRFLDVGGEEAAVEGWWKS